MKVTEDYNDSIIYAQKPKYITPGQRFHFELSHLTLRQAPISLIALQESTSNYTFDPKRQDCFLEGFCNAYWIALLTWNCFKNSLITKMMREPNYESKNKILDLKGNIDSLIRPLFELPEGYESRIYRDPKRLLELLVQACVWSRNNRHVDLRRRKATSIRYPSGKVRDLYIALKISTWAVLRLSLGIASFQANTPLVAIRPEMFSIINGILSPFFQSFLDTLRTEVQIVFWEKDEQAYRVLVLPEAIPWLLLNKPTIP